MGRDKAFVACGDTVLVDLARRALAGAGALEVLAVGGDGPRLMSLGFSAIPDEHPHEGPLGGLVTALRAARADWVAVLACDLPHINPETVVKLLHHAGDDYDVVAPLLDGRPLATCALWRRETHMGLSELFAGGERRLGAALNRLRTRLVEVDDPQTLRDADTPGDLVGLSAPAPAADEWTS